MQHIHDTQRATQKYIYDTIIAKTNMSISFMIYTELHKNMFTMNSMESI